ncbi:hypothetical protein EUGRSUZ_K03228 [Eucalyptus grandis]|uniref:Uncharacterized protein n=2 Tax=Eucalyptus grandis TaxID=71139 RepID=A0ACC3IZF6_EUCGR|nr:hypothetical protein EUGRSUZ_K03228 [Eucalyptus grandis]
MGELHVGSGLLTCRYQIESRESRGATAWQRAMSDRFELWLIVRAVSGPNKTRTSFLYLDKFDGSARLDHDD